MHEPTPIDRLIAELREEFGDFEAPSWKPYSAILRSRDGATRLKIYRTISPNRRQAHEHAAALQATRLGIRVPRVLRSGHTETAAWNVFQQVSGTPGQLRDELGIACFLNHARTLLASLHRADVDGWPGSSCRGEPTSVVLEEQLSARARSSAWWPAAGERLRVLDELPVVRLHGDIKPEHFIADRDVVHVVDWEAASIGPAVLDEADCLFHAVRDLIYDAVSVPLHLKLGVNDPQALSAALLWRIVLWADRRRPEDLDLLPQPDLWQLADIDSETQLISHLAAIVTTMAKQGTPR